MSKAAEILAAIGGKENVIDLESCITRLRLSLHDTSKVDEKALRKLGAAGVIRMGSAVQVVFGPLAERYEREIKEQFF